MLASVGHWGTMSIGNPIMPKKSWMNSSPVA